MSSCTKRKRVISEILDHNVQIDDNQKLAKMLKSRGNHLYEVRTADNQQFLVSMPSKFRNTIWIKPGNLIVFEPIKEGNKVKGEIVKVLLKEHVKQMKKDQKWCEDFDALTKQDDVCKMEDDSYTASTRR